MSEVIEDCSESKNRIVIGKYCINRILMGNIWEFST